MDLATHNFNQLNRKVWLNRVVMKTECEPTWVQIRCFPINGPTDMIKAAAKQPDFQLRK